MKNKALTLAILAGTLGGCAAPGPGAPGGSAGLSELPRYRCDHDIAFTVRFEGDSALLDAGSKGSDVLLRDAGGLTPQQTVYSNPRLRAEFGLGPAGREAILRYPQLPLVAHCMRIDARP